MFKKLWQVNNTFNINHIKKIQITLHLPPTFAMDEKRCFSLEGGRFLNNISQTNAVQEEAVAHS